MYCVCVYVTVTVAVVHLSFIEFKLWHKLSHTHVKSDFFSLFLSLSLSLASSFFCMWNWLSWSRRPLKKCKKSFDILNRRSIIRCYFFSLSLPFLVRSKICDDLKRQKCKWYLGYSFDKNYNKLLGERNETREEEKKKVAFILLRCEIKEQKSYTQSICLAFGVRRHIHTIQQCLSHKVNTIYSSLLILRFLHYENTNIWYTNVCVCVCGFYSHLLLFQCNLIFFFVFLQTHTNEEQKKIQKEKKLSTNTNIARYSTHDMQ